MNSDNLAPRRRMLVLCPFPQGVAAGQRLKYEQYFDDWRAAGYDIDVSSYMDMPMWCVVYEKGHILPKVLGVLRGHLRRLRDLLRIARYDVVYVYMWVTPFGTSVMERITRALARRLVYDVDDNVLLPSTIPAEYDPNRFLKLVKGPWKARFLITEADYVITSAPHLSQVCRNLNRNKSCFYIPPTFDPNRFRPRETGTNDKVVIGWTGTYSSKEYLDLLRPALLKLAGRASFKLRLITNFPYDLPGVDVEVIRWSRETEVEDLQVIDIGIYPLPNDDWALSKGGLKAIQYMAFGIPTVASNVGATPEIIANEVHGLLVATETEWVEALNRLIQEPDTRRRMGEAARLRALEKYSTTVIMESYRKIIGFSDRKQ